MKIMLIKLKEETHRSLKVKVAREGRSMSDVIRKAIDQYLNGTYSPFIDTRPRDKKMPHLNAKEMIEDEQRNI